VCSVVGAELSFLKVFPICGSGDTRELYGRSALIAYLSIVV
jgi:hypothetical protein